MKFLDYREAKEARNIKVKKDNFKENVIIALKHIQGSKKIKE